MVQRTCTVSVKDVRDVEHSIEVTAESLYEAIATALAALQQDNREGEIGQGFATVTVLVQQLEKILCNVNHARTDRKG